MFINQSDAINRPDQLGIFLSKCRAIACWRLETCSQLIVNKMCTITTYSDDLLKKYDILCAFY